MAQASLAGAAYVLNHLSIIREALHAFPGFVHIEAKLRCDDRLLATTRQRLPQDVLTVAGAIVRGSVEEGNPYVQRRMNCTDGLSVIHLPPNRPDHRPIPKSRR